ncbi:hypothetical protein RRG08_018073 [Elysia crispata]|uniref:Transmembrane protein 59 n=1 Tax=Elysia crispata TaxID=231223 RepID=A0AAE1DF69_9GAST|nr:hypothetical protein RRG08_018073 [Elysia crispata]
MLQKHCNDNLTSLPIAPFARFGLRLEPSGPFSEKMGKAGNARQMETLNSKVLFCCSILAFASLSTASSLFRDLISDVDVCEDVCQKTYPAHTYDKSLSEDCCKRGCRLYSIIELVGAENGVNGTLKACYDNCNDAYPDQNDESAACVAGCDSQKPFKEKWSSIPGLDLPFSDSGVEGMMYPFLYMHNMYSNVVDKVAHQMSVSWSFFMQDGTGRLVVIKSQPQMVDMDVQDLDDYSAFRGTSSVAETNIEPAERTATEMLRLSQLNSARAFGDEINTAEADSWKAKQSLEEPASDWLTCIAHKTGIPRLFLCVLILLSAISMIWLCMSAAVGNPEQKLPQKLSIKSMDMDYLRYLPEKKGIKGIHPQDVVEARPLPIKIRIEQI